MTDTPTPTPPPPGWERILDPGEEILWQGTPEPGLAWSWGQIGTMIFGLFFAGFALFWMVMAAQAGGGFWMFGLLHFSVGAGLVAAPVLWPAWVRRHTWYTLTDRRAIIATDVPVMGRRLRSWPITDRTVLDYDAGSPGTIYFASDRRRFGNTSRNVQIGFERVADAEEAYRLLRQVQREALTGGSA